MFKLARQCAESVWIKNIEPSKRINNKEEYHQPGDVEVSYNKNVNEKYKSKEKNMNSKKVLEVSRPAEENSSKVKEKVSVEVNISDFLKEMRRKNAEKEKAEAERNDELEDNLTSTQNMMEDARARRDCMTEGRFKCKMCEFKSGSKNTMNRHKKTHQSEERVYPCDQCEYTSNNKHEIKTHVESVHEKEVYACEQCEYKSLTNENLKTHIESVHKGNKVLNQRIWTEKEVLDSTSQPEIIGTRTLPHPPKDQEKEHPSEKNNKKKKPAKHVSKRINCELCERKFNK